MSGAALALVLLAGCIHAAWNALAKRAGSPLCFLWCSVSLAALLFAPFALLVVARDGFPGAALPYVVATVVIHASYFYTLGRALAGGDFSVVYPVARGLGVGLVPVAAFVLLGERLSPLGTTGVVLVVAGIVATHAASRGVRNDPAAGRGTTWAAATGVAIASYSLVDKVGVSLAHPVPYLAVTGVGISVLLWPAVQRSGGLRREWSVNRPTILVAATLNLTSYLLVLFAFRLSKAGYVVAAREISIVLSVLIGHLWMNEQGLGRRLAGALLVLGGVACIALAR